MSESSGRDYGYWDLDDLIFQAFEDGREVDLVKADDYGYHIVIDGVAITSDGSGEGMPRESFGYPIDSWPRTPEAEQMVEKLLQAREKRRTRNQGTDE